MSVCAAVCCWCFVLIVGSCCCCVLLVYEALCDFVCRMVAVVGFPCCVLWYARVVVVCRRCCFLLL